MTEREWHTSADPTAMLQAVIDRVTNRKLRLYLVGCCRRRWEWFDDERLRRLIQVAERLADGRRTEADLDVHRRPIWNLYGRADEYLGDGLRVRATASVALFAVAPAAEFEPWRLAFRQGRRTHQDADSLAVYAGWLAAMNGGPIQRDIAFQMERAAQADLLRCVLGDPFTVTVPDPRWLTDTVTALARRVYDRRDFAVLPILADALEEVGCEDGELLNHCRHGREHARGCWAVDLLLGKS